MKKICQNREKQEVKMENRNQEYAGRKRKNDPDSVGMPDKKMKTEKVDKLIGICAVANETKKEDYSYTCKLEYMYERTLSSDTAHVKPLHFQRIDLKTFTGSGNVENNETEHKPFIEECEMLIDVLVNKKGACNFTVISGSHSVLENLVTENNEITKSKSKIEKSDSGGKEIGASRTSDDIVEECEAVVDVKGQGYYNLTNVQNKQNEHLQDTSNAFNSCIPAISDSKKVAEREITWMCSHRVKTGHQQTETDIVNCNLKSAKDAQEEENKLLCDQRSRAYSNRSNMITPGMPVENKATALVYEQKLLRIPEECNIVALDCEFVGVGPRDQSAIGRCSIVDFHGNILCDIYAKPEERITNYRTRWSGITRRHMKKSIPVQRALSQIANIIKNKIVVGHAVHNDFLVLSLPHPKMAIRDTAYYHLLRQNLNPTMEHQSVSLKRLAMHLLDRVIQKRKHCSVEDARAAMDIYKIVRNEWENSILLGHPVQDVVVKSPDSNSKSAKRREKRKRRQERLYRNMSSVSVFCDHLNNKQTINFHKSKTDSRLES